MKPTEYTFRENIFTFIFTFVKQNGKEENNGIAMEVHIPKLTRSGCVCARLCLEFEFGHGLTGTLLVLLGFIYFRNVYGVKNQQIHYAYELCKGPFKCAKLLRAVCCAVCMLAAG